MANDYNRSANSLKLNETYRNINCKPLRCLPGTWPCNNESQQQSPNIILQNVRNELNIFDRKYVVG